MQTVNLISFVNFPSASPESKNRDEEKAAVVALLQMINFVPIIHSRQIDRRENNINVFQWRRRWGKSNKVLPVGRGQAIITIK